jgi:2-pyrone-4,6-dicarboxylate lactonase
MVFPLARALAAVFPERVITGTDGPHPNMKDGQMPNDGELLNCWIWEITGQNIDELERILVHNPRRLFNFAGKS